MVLLRYLLASIRLLLFAGVTSTFIAIYLFRSLFLGRDLSVAFRFRTAWCHIMFPLLGIRLHKEGDIFEGPAFYMGNHISYIDPAVVLRHVHIGRVVGKSEVSKWPVIGMAGEVTGAIFLTREDIRSRANVRQAIVNEWKKGYSIINYPEGTTSKQSETLPFKIGGFSAAAQNGIPVVPVALWFTNPDAAFVAEDSFLPSFLKCFGAWKNDVWLGFGKARTSTDARRLLEETRSWIDQSLQKFSAK